MKKIFYAGIRNGQMAEINEAEYSEGWDSVEEYIINALENAWDTAWEDLVCYALEDGIPGDILQNFGGTEEIEQITTLYLNGEPREIWWMAEAEDE